MGNKHSEEKGQLNETEWRDLIQKQRQNKYDGNDYELLIQYLSDPQTTSNDVISNIARIIRYYMTKTQSVTLCDFCQTNFKFEGVKVSIAIHPINGDIYIADEYKIFKFIKKNTLQLIAKIPDALLSKRSRITDLSFHPDGNILLCLIDNDLSSVYYIDYKNDAKITISKRFDKMDICKYDFTHYYLSNNLIKKLFPRLDFKETDTIGRDAQSRIWSHGSLYVSNCYNKEIWRLQNIGLETPIIYKIKMDQDKDDDKHPELLEEIQLSDDSDTMSYGIAFDVDKYFGGIYIITYQKILYRFEKRDDEWRKTHQYPLENELPVGIATIRYDSVIGRIIIADNYKLHALYL